jgi:hypothetical protein
MSRLIAVSFALLRKSCSAGVLAEQCRELFLRGDVKRPVFSAVYDEKPEVETFCKTARNGFAVLQSV